MTTDRRVHASYPGQYGTIEVVRYDRAGKWYVEGIRPGERARITLDAAVARADYASFCPGGQVFLGLPGGGAFDAEYRRVHHAT